MIRGDEKYSWHKIHFCSRAQCHWKQIHFLFLLSHSGERNRCVTFFTRKWKPMASAVGPKNLGASKFPPTYYFHFQIASPAIAIFLCFHSTFCPFAGNLWICVFVGIACFIGSDCIICFMIGTGSKWKNKESASSFASSIATAWLKGFFAIPPYYSR